MRTRGRSDAGKAKSWLPNANSVFDRKGYRIPLTNAMIECIDPVHHSLGGRRSPSNHLPEFRHPGRRVRVAVGAVRGEPGQARIFRMGSHSSNLGFPKV